MSKKKVYLVNDPATGQNLVQETMDDLKDWLEGVVDGLHVGEKLDIEIEGIEMSEEEIANLPEAD